MQNKLKITLLEAIKIIKKELTKVEKDKNYKNKKQEVYLTTTMDETGFEFKVEKLNSTSEDNILVSILMGSESDKAVMEAAAEIFKNFGIKYEMKIISAHRLPNVLKKYLDDIQSRGIELIIAGAGMAAHLPGVVASQVKIPVIGVPIQAGPLSGLDALLSIVQMPSGVPVATMAINGSKNAAILGIQILSIKYPNIRRKYENFINETREKLEKLANI